MNNPDEFVRKAKDMSKKGWQDFLQLDRLNQFNIVALIVIALLFFSNLRYFGNPLYPLIYLIVETLVLGFFVLSLKQSLRLSISITLGLLLVEYLNGTLFPLLIIPKFSELLVGWLFFGNYLNFANLLIVAALSPLSIALINLVIPRNMFIVTWAMSLVRSLLVFLFVLLNAPVSFVAIWIVTILLYRHERRFDSRNEIAFRYNRPFFFFGTILTESELFFQNAQEFASNVIESVRKTASAYNLIDVTDMSITDIAANAPYNKQFLRATYQTRLETKISVVYRAETILNTLYFKWWVLYQGRIGLWDLIIYIVLSPLTFAFWIIAWLFGEYSIVAAISGDIKHSYDVLDIESFVIAFQQEFYQKLIQDLEDLGVDVSVYRAHPPVFNQFNLNGSGNIIGAVAQGAGSQATARVAASPTR